MRWLLFLAGCPAGWSSRLTWAYLSEYSSAFNGAAG